MPAVSRILELGCGPAELWVKNIDRVPSAWRITLSDLSEGMVREARQNLQSGVSRFSFAVCDAQRVPFDDESFDAVIANHMLYHVSDRQRAYAEIRRVLRPGGAALCGHKRVQPSAGPRGPGGAGEIGGLYGTGRKIRQSVSARDRRRGTGCVVRRGRCAAQRRQADRDRGRTSCRLCSVYN
ncbi:MAG: class I SAM-dependent methyltransferase [Chloroflexi bacterium]|nr:class I SAM-dependent methyltransferase [Chloroflexota bacterium]